MSTEPGTGIAERGPMETWVAEQAVCREHAIPLSEIPVPKLLAFAREQDARLAALTAQNAALVVVAERLALRQCEWLDFQLPPEQRVTCHEGVECVNCQARAALAQNGAT